MPKSDGLRVVWLEAFVAVVDGGTQGAAAKELELNKTSVSRYVGALELWLHKVLLDPAVPGQLFPDGEDFLITAIEVLLLLKKARGAKRGKFGQLRIEWLEAFVARAENPKQVAAADLLGVDQPEISRHIKSLSAWLGEPLVEKKGDRDLTRAGKRFLPVAQDVLRLLNGAKASLPPLPLNTRHGPAAPTKFIKIPDRRGGA